MILGVRRHFWWLFAATLLLAAAAVFVRVSPIFAVKRSVLSGPLHEKAGAVSANCRLDRANLFAFDVNRFLNEVLAQDGIGRVTVTYAFPDGLRADINRFRPVALVFGRTLQGLDRHCRLIPYDSAWDDLNLPILTGLRPGRLFSAPDDFRLPEIVSGLAQVAAVHPALARRIAEIDFSDSLFVTIRVTTGPEIYQAAGHDFARQLYKLQAVSRLLDTPDDGLYRLQYDGLVIRKQQKEQNVTDTSDRRT
jgi:cell division septal protein FtsQ